MPTEQEWEELSGYYNGAVTGVIRVIESSEVAKALNAAKVVAGELPMRYNFIPVNSASVRVIPSLQRNVDSHGQVSWGANKKKGTEFNASFSDPLLFRAGLFFIGVELEFWVGLEGRSWKLFSGWISAPVTQSFDASGLYTVRLKANDSIDVSDARFVAKEYQLILSLRGMGSKKIKNSIKKVLETYCTLMRWTLMPTAGLHELDAKIKKAGNFKELFDKCGSSLNMLLDHIIIQNGFAYFVEKDQQNRTTLAIVGKRGPKAAYQLQYASAEVKKGLNFFSDRIVQPYAHLRSPTAEAFKFQNEAAPLSEYPDLVSFVNALKIRGILTVRALSISNIRPSKNQLSKAGGIVNTAQVMGVVDAAGKFTWLNTAVRYDVLQPKVIWVATKHLFPWKAASKAMGMTAAEFRRKGWVIQRIDLEEVKDVKLPPFMKLDKPAVLGYDCTVKTVGFPYPTSHDIIYLKGVHDQYEGRKWRLMQWTHNYSARRGWFTTLMLGT